MPIYSIIVVNKASGCTSNLIEQQLDLTGCTSKILSLSLYSNSYGPYDIYINSTATTAVYSSITRTQLMSGVTVNIGC